MIETTTSATRTVERAARPAGTKCGRQPVRDESFLLVQSMALLDLMEERERCATHWERAEVDARIAQVRARK